DRIESQILTHYPRSIEIAREITRQEAKLPEVQKTQIHMPELLEIVLEQIAFEARGSEFIDEKSGVSARLSIAGYENLMSTAERRMLINGESKTTVRITDLWGVIPAITGKVELVYEGEQEGPYNVAIYLMSTAIKSQFLNYFPDPDQLKKGQEKDPYGTIRAWFSGGNSVQLLNDASDETYANALREVAGLERLVKKLDIPESDRNLYMELALHGLAEFNVINKDFVDSNFSFRDLLADMLDDDLFDDFDD
ncbi:MAG: magnesium chelatase, partial [Phaeodactylibacter sp.]|nr:magnesium chelatase [Phaeodactylibacter sp.]